MNVVTSHRTGLRWVIAGGIALLLILSIGRIGTSYRVIEEMEQEVAGKTATVVGRVTWPKNVTIHVYIPGDPENKGAEREVEAACRALEAKLRSETNANITFAYHVGRQAPPMGPNDPPPYVIDVGWTDEQEGAEAGTATPITDVEPTGRPNEYRRTSGVLRGIVRLVRQGPDGDPYNGNAIYNVALHELLHLFGLDHKTPDQDSVIMANRGIDDGTKKLPIKDDDVRGLQTLYGRSETSRVPEPPPSETSEEKKCCAFEFGGQFGCEMVADQAECDGYNGVLQEGICVTPSQEEQDQGILGRCNGGLDPGCEDCLPDLGRSHCESSTSKVLPGDPMEFVLHLDNQGSGVAWIEVELDLPENAEHPTIVAGQGVTIHRPWAGTATWRGALLSSSATQIAIRAMAPEDTVSGETFELVALIHDVVHRTTIACAATAVAAEPEATTYVWSFTVTPRAITLVSIPMPEPIRQALLALGVCEFVLTEGGLPPSLSLDTTWNVAGVVLSPGFFLPFSSATTSIAVFGGVDGDGSHRATLVIQATIAAAQRTESVPRFGSPKQEPDSDGDTVPDAEDDCPDVPGDPAFHGCPGWEPIEDRDGDGVPDSKDACPELPGPAENGGCPEPDA